MTGENNPLYDGRKQPIADINNVKPVYKPDNEKMSFIYRLNLYPLFINGENETALYRQ